MNKKKKVIITILICVLVASNIGTIISTVYYYKMFRYAVSEHNKRVDQIDALNIQVSELNDRIEEYENQSNTETTEIAETTETEDTEDTEEKMEPGEMYFEYSGNGDDVVTGCHSNNELGTYAEIVHEGDGFFCVEGYYDDEYDLLVNTTEPYSGRVLLNPDKDYTFAVTAEGDWSIKVYNYEMSYSDSFSGEGDYVTPFFLGTSDTYEITTKGDGHFSVTGYSRNGEELLVNTTDDDYSGKVYFNIKDEGAFFVINAEREWEIKPVK